MQIRVNKGFVDCLVQFKVKGDSAHKCLACEYVSIDKILCIYRMYGKLLR